MGIKYLQVTILLPADFNAALEHVKADCTKITNESHKNNNTISAVAVVVSPPTKSP